MCATYAGRESRCRHGISADASPLCVGGLEHLLQVLGQVRIFRVGAAAGWLGFAASGTTGGSRGRGLRRGDNRTSNRTSRAV